MNAKVHDVMSPQTVTVQPHHTLGHVRAILRRNRIGAVPVVGQDKELVGILSAADLVQKPPDGAKVSDHMTKRVYSVPEYNDVSVAARVMRKHHIHHVVVTKDHRVVGIVSAFDLLALIEDKRFVIKAAP